MYCFLEALCIQGNMCRLTDYRHERKEESQMHHDKHYTGSVLHALYYES